MDLDEREQLATSLHEAGHAVAARALRRRVTLVTAEPGARWAGCAWSRARPVRARVPSVDRLFGTWPAAWQARLAHDLMVALSGTISEAMFTPHSAGRAEDSPGALHAAVRADDLAGAPAATAEERRRATEGVDAEGVTDAESAENIVFVAFGADWMRGLAWRGWLEQETTELLRANEAAVRRMASLLMARGVVGEQAAAAALRGVAR